MVPMVYSSKRHAVGNVHFTLIALGVIKFGVNYTFVQHTSRFGSAGVERARERKKSGTFVLLLVKLG